MKSTRNTAAPMSFGTRAIRRGQWSRATVLLLGLSTCIPSTPLLAQSTTPSPGQLLPRSFVIEPAPPDLLQDVAPAQAAPSPAGEQAQVRFRQIVLNDAGLAPPAGVVRLLEGMAGRSLGFAQLQAAAALIEQMYADSGYFLTRVVIPPQTVMDDGVLQIQVVQGFIETIDVSGLPVVFQERVRQTLEPLLGRTSLSRREFEQSLIFAGDAPGLSMQTVLAPGEKQGAVILSLKGAHQTSNTSFRIDNWLPGALGRYSTNASFSINSPTMVGEQFYGSIGASPHQSAFSESSPHRLVAVGALWPLGYRGWSFNTEYVWSATHPQVAADVLDTQSKYQRMSLRLNNWLWRNRSDSMRMRMAFDAIDAHQRSTQFNVDLYEDRLRVARFGLDWSAMLTAMTNLSASIDFSQGLRGSDSRGRPNSADQTPLSQALASNVFNKTEARVQMRHWLSERFAFDVLARGQTTPGKPLVTSEKFSMGGEGDLSAADASSLSGDRGWVTRAELQWQAPFREKAAWMPAAQLYAFAAHGRASSQAPTAVQFAAARATDVGIGLRTSTQLSAVRKSSLHLQVELARERRTAASAAPDGVRLHASMSLRF